MTRVRKGGIKRTVDVEGADAVCRKAIGAFIAEMAQVTLEQALAFEEGLLENEGVLMLKDNKQGGFTFCITAEFGSLLSEKVARAETERMSAAAAEGASSLLQYDDDEPDDESGTIYQRAYEHLFNVVIGYITAEDEDRVEEFDALCAAIKYGPDKAPTSNSEFERGMSSVKTRKHTSCPHVVNPSSVAFDVALVVKAQSVGRSRAEMNEEVRLCAACAGTIAGVLNQLAPE